MSNSPRTKEWLLAILLAVLAPVVVYLLWVTTQFVIASQEIKHAHILPKDVQTEGWSGADEALSQNLPGNAPFGSFTRENSAYIELAASTSTEDNPEEILIPATSPASTSTPPVSPEETLPTSTQPLLELPFPVLVPSTTPAAPHPPELPSTDSSPGTTTAPVSPSPADEVSTTTAPSASTSTSELPEPVIIDIQEIGTSSESISSSSTVSLLDLIRPAAGKGLEKIGEFLLAGLAEIAFATSSGASTPATTTSDAVASPEASTPNKAKPSASDVSTCVVLAIPCHTLNFSGFSVSGSLTEKEFHGAKVSFSFANLTPESLLADGKLQVRFYHEGLWRTAGEVYLNKELSNAGNGGYFSSELKGVDSWEDLNDLRVEVEFVRGDEGQPIRLYLDALWIDATYKDRVQEILSGEAGEETKDAPKNVSFTEPAGLPSGDLAINGTRMLFPYRDSLLDSKLVLRTNQTSYRASATGTSVYITVTNESKQAESFRLISAMATGTVERAEQFMRNVPTEAIVVKRDNVTYFCESTWKRATSSNGYTCEDSGVTYTCTWLNEDESNCLVAGVAVASSTQVAYTDSWIPLAFDSSLNQADLSQEVSKRIPEGYAAIKAAERALEILPGQTVYLRVRMSAQGTEDLGFVVIAEGEKTIGSLNASKLRKETALKADKAATKKRADSDRINKQLSSKNSFTSEELPEFKFQYNSQRNVLVRWFKQIFRIEVKANVNEVLLVHHSGKHFVMPADVTYSGGGEWQVKFRERPNPLMPGEYTLIVEIEEDGYVYQDAHSFAWGVLAINPVQAVYSAGQSAEVHMAALSPNGNTICNADLVLTVTDPNGVEQSPEIIPSGLCDGNNFVEVPDYSASFETAEPGIYHLMLTRLDDDGVTIATIEDAFEVREVEDLPLVVIRKAPTRINPTHQYQVEITVEANEPFSGLVREPVPQDFSIVSSDGRVESGVISWNVSLKKGESRMLRYTYDSRDVSPYLFTTGPLKFTEDDELFFEEYRAWQIASDAAGSMIIFWDDGASIPSGWSCISCTSGDAVFQRFVRGFDTYGATSGAATMTHTATGAVNASAAASTENNTSSNISEVAHTHTYSPTISSTSSLPLYRQLRIIRSTSAGEPATIPTGAILVFDTTVPSGWAQYSAQDGRYALGENTVGTSGGNNTHLHTISGNTGAAGGSNHLSRGGGVQTTGASASHTHSVSTSTSIVNNEPPYLEVILGKLNASTSTPNDIIAMWDGDLPEGWLNQSQSGGDFYQRFIKPGTSYGTTGGSSTHTHVDITGLTSGAPSASTNGRTGAAGASAAHTHAVDITNFSYDSGLPPYIDVIFGKRHAGISVYEQAAFRWYANMNAEPPTDPWPFGPTDLLENEVISASNAATSGVALRLRMAVGVTNSTTTAGSVSFRLQYASSTSCSAAPTWNDVGDTSSTTALWRGFNNAGVSDGATLSSTTLTVSDVFATYEEENDSAAVPNEIPKNQYAEWDWVLQHNGAVAGGTYCFRMVRTDGSALDEYSQYPTLVTNSSPATPTLSAPFPNQKATSTTPRFIFSLVDSESNPIDYEIQVGTDSTFATALVIDANTVSSPTAFDNLTTGSDPAPFNSGDTITHVATTTLSNGTTYWWRIRGKDEAGSNAWGPWSAGQSFTIDTSVTVDTWFQTTDAQFSTDTLSGVQTGSNSISLIAGSSTGYIFSSPILFSYGIIGNAWGTLSWSDTEPPGDIKYHIEYFSSTSTWTLVPDTDLAGNAAGFDTSSVSILGLSPTTYSQIRVRGDLADSGGSPTLSDWTVQWGFRVNTPTLFFLFDNEKTGTTSPSFEFTTTDPQGDALVYEISWSTDPTFMTGTTTRTSDSALGFSNLSDTGDTSPFTSGNRIKYIVQSGDALTNGSTYWWRVRAKDPSGGNAYSEWSSPRSFTVDTTVVQSTWFQTTDAQFDADTLSGVYAVSNSLQVATSVADVMLVYGEGSVQIPRYRIWDGSSWGDESSAQTVGSTINYVVTKAHPRANEFALATLGTNSNIYAQVYQSDSWGNKQLLTTTVNSTNARAMDLAYETTSGDLLAVYCDGDANPSYRVFNGTSWGSASAIATGLSSNCNWLKLASDPTSDEIIMLMQTADGATFQAQVWDGSAWGNSTTLGTNNSPTAEAMAVEYEESGGQAIILSSDGNPSRFQYKTWSGSAWSAGATQSVSTRILWASLRRDTGSDNMIVSYVDNSSNVGVVRWTGSAWAGQTNLAAGTADTTADRPVDAVFETSSGRDGFIMVPYSNTTAAQYQFWNGSIWSGASALASIARSATVQAARDGQGRILSLLFDHVNNRYDFSWWDGSAWATLTTLESTPSVGSSPFKEPFMMAPRNSVTSGQAFSARALFTEGAGPKWSSAFWSDSQTGGSTVTYRLQYFTSTSSWANVLDADLTGANPGLANSVGTSTGPIDLTGLSTTTYSTLRLRADFACNGSSCPVLNDWTIRWAQGITVSGTARQFDQVSNVTSGNVAVAVNGSLQVNRGSISGGTWSVVNVNANPGDVITAFIEGAADANEAVAVTKYTGGSAVLDLPLYERHLSLMATSTGPLTNSILSSYDNSASGNEDIFFNVDSNNDLTVCATSGCFDSRLIIGANTSYEPDVNGSGNVTTRHLQNNGTFVADANTISVSGSWRNSAAFIKGTSTVVFTATSTTETIDDTSATSTGFYTITFGQSSGSALWNLSNPLYASSTLSINFGTLAQNGGNPILLDGSLSVGSSGLFAKGTASTTFAGSTSATWTDSSSAKQDFGTVVIDGSSKTVTLASSVRATDVWIGANDTLDAGGANTFNVNGNWTNNNVFTAQTGTVAFVATSTGRLISTNGSNFYNLTFNGANGNWSFTTNTVTALNDFTIATGTVTLPTATTTVGGSWDTLLGAFQHNNGSILFNSSASGESIRLATTTPFNYLTFNGSGSWSFTDQNATTSRTLVIQAGTVTMPSGVLALGGSLDTQGGSFSANNGTLKFTGVDAHTIRMNNSNAASMTFSGTGGVGGAWTFTETNATTTGTFRIEHGTTTLPVGSLGIGGSLLNVNSPSSGFTNNNGIVRFVGTATGNTIAPGSSVFSTLVFNGAGGGWTITENATSTASTTIVNVQSLTLASGQTLEVGGQFSNAVGSATTWTGSNLYLAGGIPFAINTKSQSGAAYGQLTIGGSTKVSMWSSSASGVVTGTSAHLYSQDNAAIDGSLYIYGAYANAGPEYWAYATDFDGTALGGSSRAASVRIASSSIITLSGSSTIVGSPTASTTVANQGIGTYDFNIVGGTTTAQYYTIASTSYAGVSFTGSPYIASLQDGEFMVSLSGATAISVNRTVLEKNPNIQIERVQFSTTTILSNAFNVVATTTPSPLSSWWFRHSYGNFDGEDFDNDAGDLGGNPGYIQWDDSGFVVTVAGNVYADHYSTPIGSDPCSTAGVVKVVTSAGQTFSGDCDTGTGAYSIPNVTFPASGVLTVYLDTNGGKRAVTVTKSATTSIANLDLYQNALIIRQEDTSPNTIADLAFNDSNFDSDIPFTATSSLMVQPNTELYIWRGKFFAPGGDVVLQGGGSGDPRDGRLYLATSSTFTATGAQNHAIGGGFFRDTGTTFTAAQSTFTFAATTTGKEIYSTEPTSFYDVVFNGPGGQWIFYGTSTATTSMRTLTPTNGTLTGAGDVDVRSGGVTGTGVISMTGGTFLIEATGNFGNSNPWTFNHLTFGTSTANTVTKTGAATTTVTGVLRIAANQTLNAGGDPSFGWILSGAGTPFSVAGVFNAQNAPFYYTGTSATNVTATTYAALAFAPVSGSPTYTVLSGVLTSATTTIGNGTNAVTLSATANDPTIDFTGDLAISSNATFVASDLVDLNAKGSWTNNGTFTASGRTVIFDATATGKTVTPGNSSFSNLTFNSSSGGWTVNGNATSTSNTALSSAASFTLSNGRSLEVGGTFTNSVASSSQTWTGSTLYLNSGTSYSMNGKSSGNATYGTLSVGASTHIRNWNSAQASTNVHSTGSLYAQNYASSSGALNVYGAYTRSGGSDYWSYVTDFDGVDLSATPRKVNVSVASSSSLVFSGGLLDILGVPTASTTIQVLGSGAYAWSVSGGTLNAQYYEVRDTDPNGLNISGYPIVSSLSNGDFLTPASGNTSMTVAGTVLTVNQLKVIRDVKFATSTGVVTAFNVASVSATSSFWRFNRHYGNLAGEQFDNDADPGFIRWDNSADQITVAGKVYADEGSTVSGPGLCNGSSQVVRLKVGGTGDYASSCNGSGDYSIPGVSYLPGDSFVVYLDTGSSTRGATISRDPAASISDMDVYESRIIVRHEAVTPLHISDMVFYDHDDDLDIPFVATDAATDTLLIEPNTKLIVWTGKTFAPVGNVTIESGGLDVWDGSLQVYANGSFAAAGTQAHSVGGSFVLDTGATFSAGNSTVTFTATTTGKTITPRTSSFYNITFNGVGGNWAFSGAATTSNDFIIATGTVTLPTSVLEVGSSFINQSGTFQHNNGTVKLTSTSVDKAIGVNTSAFYDLSVNGSGGSWRFVDGYATTSNNFTITAGTLRAPSSTVAVAGNFTNAGTFNANTGTVKMTALTGGKTIQTGSSDFYNLTFDGLGGGWSFPEGNATTTRDLTIATGTPRLPAGTLAVGGSFQSPSSSFLSNGGTVKFNATTTGFTINVSTSTFAGLLFDSSSGGWTIVSDATSTATTSISNAANFVLAPGKSLEVGGAFSNSAPAATTWTDSTLYLNSSSSYTVNSKTSGAEFYGQLTVGAGSQLRIWQSAASTTSTHSGSSLYSQDHGGVDGVLQIFGAYARSSGTDYWSYETDFDGAALGGSPRQVDVRIATSASMTVSGGTLNMVGSTTATTTVNTSGTAAYPFSVTAGTLNASYYQFRNFDSNGIYFSGTPTIASLSNGDFEMSAASGTIMSLAGTVVDANANLNVSAVGFSTTTTNVQGFNVYLTSTPGSFWTFSNHYGNFDGEAYDADGVTLCGRIRWDDSDCSFNSEAHFRWRNDDGGEGALNSEWYDQSFTKRKKIAIANANATNYTDIPVQIAVAYDPDMRADFYDLRFTSSDGTTLLDHWTEASTTATSTVWVQVPSLPSNSSATVYMYYGSSTAPSVESASNTFSFIDDFEDDDISNYTFGSGQEDYFDTTTGDPPAHNGRFGLDVPTVHETDRTTAGGMWRTSSLTSPAAPGHTIRYFQYVDASATTDQACTYFGVQGNAQNYAVCFEVIGTDHISLDRNVSSNESGSPLDTENVTWVTGWYEVIVDWKTTSPRINVAVYNSSGTLFGTLSSEDTTYTSSGGVGFGFFHQHGAWDTIMVKPYTPVTPTYVFGSEQMSGGATWKAAEDSAATGVFPNENVRLRFSIQNTGTAISSALYRLQYAPMGSSLNCEAVSSDDFDPVPTNGSCGSDGACMKASSEFTNLSSTSPLLSYPADMNFTPGYMVEDTSNATNAMSYGTNTATEVEYNFQMTNNATQSNYCFRVVNDATVLANYDRVARLTVVHPPILGPIDLVEILTGSTTISLMEGATTTVYASTTVTDNNGYADIIYATSTIFRSSTSSSPYCVDNLNSCYQVSSTSCMFSNCSGNSCTLQCRADLQYFAEPTDQGLYYGHGGWRAYIAVEDSSGLRDTDSNIASSTNVLTLRALQITTGDLDYGSVEVGANTGTFDATTTVRNSGNVPIDVTVAGTSTVGSPIPVNTQKYATTTFAYGSCAICAALSESAANVNVNILKPTSTTTAQQQEVYWGIEIPTGTQPGVLTGYNTFIAVAPP